MNDVGKCWAVDFSKRRDRRKEDGLVHGVNPAPKHSWLMGIPACCKSAINAHKGVERYGQNQRAGLSGPGVLVTVPETASIGRILA